MSDTTPSSPSVPGGDVEPVTSGDVIELEAGPAEPPPPPPPRPKSVAPAVPLSPLSAADLPARRWPPESMGDLMTRQLIAIDETEPLGDIEEAMLRFRFGHLPVVSDGRKLVGLITRTDYLHAALGTTPDGKPTLEKVGKSTPAGVIMRQKVITAKIDTPILTALQVMLQEKLGCLPVVLDDATLVGIVTSSDFNRLALLALEALEQSKRPAAP